ncbi:MAG: ABC transporter permease [Lachnospiraceae bacterium]|nr:ABC transporter permease [Lachnospiraceae bacterium]
MDLIGKGIREAFFLIISLDAEVFEVVGLSLWVSLSALFLAGAGAVPAGIWIAGHSFRGKHVLMRVIYTLMGMPPVLGGLLVYVVLMRRGPLGFLRLNYTPAAMIIAQTLLILPILLGLTINAAQEKEEKISRLARTLGAGRLDTALLFLFELRYGLMTAVISGFSRGISEVGAVMIVGGNIEGKTRVMTTYISQLKGMGNFERAVAVGLILLALSFLINTLLYGCQRGRRD